MIKQSGWLALLVGAGIAVFGALIHWVAPLLGPDWYAFLTAPAWVVDSARQGTWPAPLGALVIGGLMFVCGWYGLAGAGALPRLPLLRSGLCCIASICLLRGLLLLPFLLYHYALLSAFDIVASFVWFSAGLAFLLGTVSRWQLLKVAA